MYLIGQLCGIVGGIITVLQPQCRRKEWILICCILVNAMNALNFALIGTIGSAVFLCLIAIAQSLVAICHERRGTEVSAREAVIFFVLYVGFGLYGLIASDGFAWKIDGYVLLELLPVVGAVMLMLSVFSKGEQRTRFFLFLNGAAWSIYTTIIGSTAVFAAAAGMISSGAAMWKYRTKR